MKINIDFSNKTIQVEEPCSLKELIEFVQTITNWEEYQIIPYTISQYPYYPTEPQYPGMLPWITYSMESEMQN